MTRFKKGERVKVLEGGIHIPTGTLGTVTEISLKEPIFRDASGAIIPAYRVDFAGCTHVYNNGKRGVWVDEPSLAPASAQAEQPGEGR